MSQKRDYYEVLGLPRGASAEEIKRAFRRLAKQYHPDVSRAPDAETRFKEVNEAYETLADPRKRQMYDQFGHAGANAAERGGGVHFEDVFSHFGSGIKDIFENFFGGGGETGSRHQQAHDGEPLKASVELNLKELLYGTKIDLRAKLYRTCSSCRGQGVANAADVKTCPACQGRGAITIQRRTPLGIIETQTACHRCRGQGRVNVNPCHTCRGRQRVLEARLITINLPPS